MKKLIFPCTLLLWGCTSNLIGMRGNQDVVVEELRSEIADLRHNLHGADIEIKLLEEKLENQSHTKTDTTAIDRKLALLEKNLEKLNSDLLSLKAFATQTTSSLTQYRDHILELNRKLDEVGKLRSTLSQMAKTTSTAQTYQVKAGDSLEKIARLHNISIEALKRENKLSSDKIIIGQELTIPQ